MYIFTNGLVVFDEETKKEYLKAGYKIVEEQVTIDEVIEEKNENDKNDISIKSKPRRINKVSK